MSFLGRRVPPSSSTTWFRQCDRRFPFLWDTDSQAAARWHAKGEGPVQYLADTPDGAWAEFLRHEEITDPADLIGVRRSLWAIEVPNASEAVACSRLDDRTLLGDRSSYPACREEARRLRASGVSAIEAPSAALAIGGACGTCVHAGFVDGPPRDGRVLALFGPRPGLCGWRCALDCTLDERLLALVRPM
jgi:hypothetical protein